MKGAIERAAFALSDQRSIDGARKELAAAGLDAAGVCVALRGLRETIEKTIPGELRGFSWYEHPRAVIGEAEEAMRLFAEALGHVSDALARIARPGGKL